MEEEERYFEDQMLWCGKLCHYTTQCPLKKKDKDEKHDLKAASAQIEEEEFAMIAQRWGDIEL